MTPDTSLEDLVLGYCTQLGALVEPPVFKIHEVLLPDDVAKRWGIGTHQHFIFAGEGEPPPSNGSITMLHYGHPLVEMMVEELRACSANGQFFINNVRLEKPGLYSVIEKAIALPNAKLFSLPNQTEKPRLYHYVRFNFKISLIADEKRELILPVWMHVQGGYPVKAADIERLASLDNENLFSNLTPAESRLLPNKNPISEEILQMLLEHASHSIPGALGDTLQSMQKRLGRFWELDQARLNQYYDELLKDANRRLQKAEEDRRPGLEAKVTAIEIERQSKLNDVEQKYHLRIEAELANLALITQPKLDLLVEIRKRNVAVQRRITWDPLLHTIEPLVCDVCGLPGYEMHLCENGHLVHAECLAPQCVECKRTYCMNCAENLHTCVVCGRPVCTHSLVRCNTCQRITCHEHTNLCHAVDGEPQRLVFSPTVTQEIISKTGQDKTGTPTPELQKSSTQTRKKEKPLKNVPAKNKPTQKAMQDAKPKGEHAEVYFGSNKPVVTVYIMVKSREVAIRSWELTSDGIEIQCKCEKLFCQDNGKIYRPIPDDQIEEQIKMFIHEFIAEYKVPERKIHYYRMRANEPVKTVKLSLSGKWKDVAFLQKAREGFDNLKYH